MVLSGMALLRTIILVALFVGGCAGRPEYRIGDKLGCVQLEHGVPRDPRELASLVRQW